MVLDDLYCGNIYPAEQVVPHEKEYRKLHRHTGELLTELEEKLSKEQMKLVNHFFCDQIALVGVGTVRFDDRRNGLHRP